MRLASTTAAAAACFCNGVRGSSAAMAASVALRLSIAVPGASWPGSESKIGFSPQNMSWTLCVPALSSARASFVSGPNSASAISSCRARAAMVSSSVFWFE